MSNTKNPFLFYVIYIPLVIYFSYLGFLAIKILVTLQQRKKQRKENDSTPLSWKYLFLQFLILLYIVGVIVCVFWFGILHKIWLFPNFAPSKYTSIIELDWFGNFLFYW